MELIDPLTSKIRTLLAAGEPNPLAAARTQYGSREDYRLLGMQIGDRLRTTADTILVDLAAFDRVGNRRAFSEFVLPRSEPQRVLFLAGSADLIDLLAESVTAGSEVSYVAIQDNAVLGGATGPSIDAEDTGVLRDLIAAHGPFVELRRYLAGQRLLSWIKETLVAPDSRLVPARDVAVLDGRRYIRMQTGMVVSAYINMKSILSSPDRLVDLAVEVCCHLFDGFRRDEANTMPDWIVVPNNTALQLGATVQAISQISLAVVDHIGPVPSAGVIAQRVSTELRDKDVVLLTDVSATGGEIDRSILFVHGLGARIRAAICPVWLGVGRCQLVAGMPFISFCQPKRDLNYEYRSE